MTEQVVFLNGEFMPISEAKVSVLDRGFIFGDGVYEVIPAYGGNLFRFSEHIQRLNNSLAGIRLPLSKSENDWLQIITDLIQKNEGLDQSIYLQITRGVAARDHGFPKFGSGPTIFAMSNPLYPQPEKIKETGVVAVTLVDNRWSNCHIKAISLLANILLRQEALEQQAQEAILIKEGHATEGAASNLFIVKDHVIKTPAKSSELLPGITRDLIVELANANNISLEEGEILESELLTADEIWLTSSTKEILPVTKLNDQLVANGRPGQMWSRMMKLYQAYKEGLRK
ncbi:MAG: D-amino acid aminotransferase [Gammaproteobacteria bacterium]|nr:D-amino acid aminotransferase [Gammaproteobacteria bacterium]